jgi:glycosyltransferase involved in cell wall biosynthesis
MNIRISAIICTHNRADFVVRAIDSLTQQTLDADSYEILVVDNGSKDETRRRCDDKCLTVANLRYLYEPRIGLSIARNTGLAAAKGHILAFLDDDAVACAGWLEGIVRVFDTARPPPGLLCGPVEPIWGASRPAWLEDHLLGFYSLLNWSESPRQLLDDEWIAGTNFAGAKDLISAFGGFDERLGRKGQSLLCGEESALEKRIRSAGHVIYYDPTMVVEHYVHPARVSKSWLYRRIFWGGAATGIQEKQVNSGPREVTRLSLRKIRLIGRRLLFGRGDISGADRPLRWTQEMANDLGQLYGLLFLGR